MRRAAPRSIKDDTKLPMRTAVAAVIILIFIPAVMALGMLVWNDRQYYIVSMLMILLSSVPFVLKFESRKPQARELVVLAVMTALAVAGRGAFFMLQQFKPVVAIVIITGIAFGGEAGFIVGACSGFVSNIFFGQGPWTPWQMFGFGIIGFLAGVLYKKGMLKRDLVSICVFGGLSTFVIYGLLLDTASLFMFSSNITWKALLASYASGLVFNAIHASATVIFLLLLTNPMLDKLDRIKTKFGLLET
ncbi:MAG: ECF transporter S component [Christensenellaceae bacterium]|nr:ECF transporter S component [Christensenellaceae bacterium]